MRKWQGNVLLEILIRTFKVPMKPIFFFEPMLTYYVLSQDCWIWAASDLSLTFFFAIENCISRFKSGSFLRTAKTTLSHDYDVVNCETQTQRTRGKRKQREVEAIGWLGRLTM